MSILNAQLVQHTPFPWHYFDGAAQYIFTNVDSINKTVRYFYVYSKEVNEASALGGLVLTLVFPFFLAIPLSTIFFVWYSGIPLRIREYIREGRDKSGFWVLGSLCVLVLYQNGPDILNQDFRNPLPTSVHRMNTLDINLNQIVFSIFMLPFLLMIPVSFFLCSGFQLFARVFGIFKPEKSPRKSLNQPETPTDLPQVKVD
ncbi:hypothetical protein [Pelagibius sp. Alg239-R121]|uniref:hypothetical protein n=1 Tax=Pelagibius sp. Alg239-R121 TaxID=2993448 RepID=UPI0024A678C2|nr:hypothetical protein [Pelagibius sp. Alg239-R121]